MLLLDIIIPGKVISNKTKYALRGRYPHAYKPPDVIQYKNLVNAKMSEYMLQHNIKPTENTVLVSGCIGIKIPDYYSKKKKVLLLNAYAKVKPDIDNCLKLAIDAISNDQWQKGGYLLQNDNQVTHLNAYKIYTTDHLLRLIVREVYNETK